MMSYLRQRGQSQGPLFCLQDGTPLNRQLLSSFIQSSTQASGWSGDFITHSFRIGAVSTAAMLNIPDYLIKAMGRWTSDAFHLYIFRYLGTDLPRFQANWANLFVFRLANLFGPVGLLLKILSICKSFYGFFFSVSL